MRDAKACSPARALPLYMRLRAITSRRTYCRLKHRNSRHAGQYIIGTLTVTVASGVSRVTPTPSVKFMVRLSLKR